MNRFRNVIKPRGAGLALSDRCARGLLRNLKKAAALNISGDEALRRLKAQTAILRALALQADQAREDFATRKGGCARLMDFARKMVAGGEHPLGVEQLMDALMELERRECLTMWELQQTPAALRIAVCEALEALSAEILYTADTQTRAQKWVEGNCRGETFKKMDFFFLERAAQICSDLERPDLQARVERLAERQQEKMEHIELHVHRVEAHRCLRLDQLTQLWNRLEHLDWEACFEKISTAEMELAQDPADVYARMEGASKARVREQTAELARRFHLTESALARCALDAAQQAANEYGTHDPRSCVCWYLMEDDGRRELARQLGYTGRIPPILLDADGKKSVALMVSCAALVLALMCCVMECAFLAVYALPLAWAAAMQLIARFYPRRVKPARLLRLKLDTLPDSARTLVVFPVLLSSVARVQEMLARMEALGCLEEDENIDFLLLGDFKDGDAAETTEDEQILAQGRDGIDRLNREARRQKYYYLHRGRSYRAQDEKWMGQNRKRGALMALNDLLLERPAAREAFSVENGCAEALAGRYRYVLTLDADTQYLPGTVKRLVGTLMHPLNRACVIHGRRRGYAVLQPDLQLTPQVSGNCYTRKTAGQGGVDIYPVAVSNFYQDVTGQGCFAGKGLYDVEAFDRATRDCLPDDRILSHDLIEGILARTGFVDDISLYEGAPENLREDLRRLNRWTRGDWQLLPLIFSNLNLSALDRLKLLGNLLRSLASPALLGLLIHAAWLDAPMAFCVGLLMAFLQPILFCEMENWSRALFRLAVLPCEAACRLDAISRTLWRLAITGKHLMDWVPAADASTAEGKPRLSGRIAFLLLLPALLRPFWIPAVLALGLLFCIGVDWAEDLSEHHCNERRALTDTQTNFLRDLAKRTWRFFEVYVPLDGCGLPPDNVQLDPNVGVAMRTSPTNIGLYMMSCFSAHLLGFLDEKKLKQRLHQTLSTLEGMEKWHGQLYNWYALESLEPLAPRYVSAVDSGNLAGALLLCAQMARDLDDDLYRRCMTLARNMDLAALYDEERQLFRIGMDAQSGRVSQAHYDLYASEARILSYVAMMLGQVPTTHWKHLSRASVRADGMQCLRSWSGTMFEYLMPELLMRSDDDTLPGISRRNVVRLQMAQAKALERPWGVSESGYYAFDRDLNYQYRAFGLPELALSGTAAQDVVAPYAAALALVEAPVEAAENLMWMAKLGWMGEFGMFEAADYMHRDARRAPRLVRSHMAHHQGMALCAICNALLENTLSEHFMQIPQARALRLLLQEKPGRCPRARGEKTMQMCPQGVDQSVCYGRNGRENVLADAHLLHGRDTTAIVTSRGAAFVWRGDWQMNRFSGNLRVGHEGAFVHARDVQSGRAAVLCGERRVRFEAGVASFQDVLGDLEFDLRLSVSPEDGTFYQALEIINHGKTSRDVEVTGCLAVAHGSRQDMRAHPIFQHLFVRSARLGENGLRFYRRRREPGEAYPELVYLLSGAKEIEFESDMAKLVGRTGSMAKSDGIARRLTESLGYVLDPCAALRGRVEVKGGERRELHFALALTKAAEDCAARAAERDAPRRATQLASVQLYSMLNHGGMDANLFHFAQRASALIFDPALRPVKGEAAQACSAMGREKLWAAGISGDQRILLLEARKLPDLDCARSVTRLHAFYRMMGVRLDFVLLDWQENDYYQPNQSKLADMIASSHLNGCMRASGGVWLLDAAKLPEDSVAAIRRAAALRFSADEDFYDQLREMLNPLKIKEKTSILPMRYGVQAMPEDLEFFNGYGGVEGKNYVIKLKDGCLPPAPWSNVLAAGEAGAIVTERGGGFAWVGNSRSDRLTAFKNDGLREGWGWMLYLLDESSGRFTRLLPGDLPMADFYVEHHPGATLFRSEVEEISFTVETRACESGLRMELRLKNEGRAPRHLRLIACVDWLMGTDEWDRDMLVTWSRAGACFASGTAKGIGCLLADDPRARAGCALLKFYNGGDMMNPQGFENLDQGQGGWILQLPLSLRGGETRHCRFLLGTARDVSAAYALAREFRSGGALRMDHPQWERELKKLEIETPDRALNFMCGGFLQAQVLNSRVLARTGLYQPGGAYGFRDQMQDMLLLLHYAPERVRAHLLYCAARQFEAGDVLHWWHDPYTGVRTHISDDLLFLPYVTARYVDFTQDKDILACEVPYLRDVPIPPEREDLYANMTPTEHMESLHQHCMRAFRRAADVGEHGLCRMGSGDWNDGMNRVGARGRGESIWLSEFLAVCALDYTRVAPDEGDKKWLRQLNEDLRAAIEQWGWDGEWYLRAYTDQGEKLGGRDNSCCRIDLISQVWASLAGLDEQRYHSAMNAAWNQLVDEENALVRLLTPPFDGHEMDPGYIAAYPPGVRENGGQYSHAACWMLYALAQAGDADRAHRVLEMLLPMNHAKDRAQADLYRVEPYVMAGDVYGQGELTGRGGWTWYTGSAAWMFQAILCLLGYERSGNRARLNTLLRTWPEARVRVQFGSSVYTLICRQDAKNVTLDDSIVDADFIEMRDDGLAHRAVFPPRQG